MSGDVPVLDAGRRLVCCLRRFPRDGSKTFFHLPPVIMTGGILKALQPVSRQRLPYLTMGNDKEGKKQRINE